MMVAQRPANCHQIEPNSLKLERETSRLLDVGNLPTTGTATDEGEGRNGAAGEDPVPKEATRKNDGMGFIIIT